MEKPFAFALMVVICMSFGISVSHAQVQGTSTVSDADTGQTAQAEADNSSPVSFVDGMMRDPGNHVGFSVGVFQVYSADKSGQLISNLNDRPQIVRFTSAQPRIFTQLQGPRSTLRLDYGFGYRLYQRSIDLNSAEHSASVQFDRSGQRTTFHLDYAYGSSNYNNRPSLDSSGHSASLRLDRMLSRRVSLQVSDTARYYSFSDAFRSSFDSGGFSSSGGALLASLLQDYFFYFGRDIYLGDQRVTSNIATVALGYVWNEKSTLGFSGGHEFQRYGTRTLGDSRGLQVGVRGDYRINEWLTFDSGYTAYVNAADSNIQRFQVGGFRYKTRGGFELSASGGVEYARYSGVNELGESVQGGVAKTVGSTTLRFTYHRGFSKANGPSILLNGNDATASVNSWLTSRLNVGAASSYLRGSSSGNTAFLETVSASGSIGFALQRHVLLSAQYSYVSQRTRNVSISANDIERYAVSAGVQYFLPRLYER